MCHLGLQLSLVPTLAHEVHYLDGMSTPVAITFRGMAPSPSVEAAIERWVARLESVYDRIERCSVVIVSPPRHYGERVTYRVHLALALPGYEILVPHDPHRAAAHGDVYVAVSDAFRAGRQQLQAIVRVRRDEGRVTGPRAALPA
jgi:hypothetical protein